MTLREKLDFLKKQRARKGMGGLKGQRQAKLNRDLALGPDESIADKFPEPHEKLKEVILKRLPADDVRRSKHASAIARHLMGDPAAKVERQMGVNSSLIHRLMDMVFPDKADMLATLETTLGANALIANAVFMQKAHELNPRDAALSAGIFAQRALELKRDREGKDITPIDFKLVVNLEATLADLNRIKQIGADKVIEIPSLQDKPNEKET